MAEEKQIVREMLYLFLGVSQGKPEIHSNADYIIEVVRREFGVRLTKQDLYQCSNIDNVSAHVVEKLPRLPDGRSITTIFDHVRHAIAKETRCPLCDVRWDTLWGLWYSD